MTSDAASEAMLAEMGACAHRLGMAFGREAERAEGWARRLELFELFDRCFYGVRVAIALKLRLRRAAVTELRAARPETREAERERPETEPLETEPRERLDADREREGERASLPLLIKTLKGVAADAAARPRPPPAELTALTALLSRTPSPAGPAARPASGALRSRLAGAAALPMTTPPPRAGPLVRGLAATGPPRR